MSEPTGRPGWIEPSFFNNRPLFPQEELLKYVDKYVAWSYDGTHIVDSDADQGLLYDRLKAAGYDMGKTVISLVDVVDSVI